MNTSKNIVSVWDRLVRIGHWTLVVAFFTAYLTEKTSLPNTYGQVISWELLFYLEWFGDLSEANMQNLAILFTNLKQCLAT